MTTQANPARLTWTRYAAGCYVATAADGTFFKVESIAYRSEGEHTERGWVLFSYTSADAEFTEDGYCNTVATAGYAKEIAQEIVDERAAL